MCQGTCYSVIQPVLKSVLFWLKLHFLPLCDHMKTADFVLKEKRICSSPRHEGESSTTRPWPPLPAVGFFYYFFFNITVFRLEFCRTAFWNPFWDSFSWEPKSGAPVWLRAPGFAIFVNAHVRWVAWWREREVCSSLHTARLPLSFWKDARPMDICVLLVFVQ